MYQTLTYVVRVPQLILAAIPTDVSYYPESQERPHKAHCLWHHFQVAVKYLNRFHYQSRDNYSEGINGLVWGFR